jgi:hypothetical protein
MKKYFAALLLLTTTIAMAPTAVRASADCQPATRAAISFSASGDNTVIASDSARSIYVWQFFFVNNDATTATNITLKEGSTSVSGAYKIAAGGSHTAGCTGTPWAIAPAGSAFVINSSAAVSVTGTVYYTYSR